MADEIARCPPPWKQCEWDQYAEVVFTTEHVVSAYFHYYLRQHVSILQASVTKLPLLSSLPQTVYLAPKPADPKAVPV